MTKQSKWPSNWPQFISILSIFIMLMTVVSVTTFLKTERGTITQIDHVIVELDSLQELHRQINLKLEFLLKYYDLSIIPVEQILLQGNKDSTYVRGIALLVVKYSQEANISPMLTTGILRIEDPTLNPTAISSAGAVGLMQIMPRFWRYAYPECGTDLENERVSLCIGTKIASSYLRQRGTHKGLLGYNGCVGGNTACGNYADLVLQAGMITAEEVW